MAQVLLLSKYLLGPRETRPSLPYSIGDVTNPLPPPFSVLLWVVATFQNFPDKGVYVSLCSCISKGSTSSLLKNLIATIFSDDSDRAVWLLQISQCSAGQ